MTYNPGYKSVGFRDVQVFELDANGFPNAPDTSPYVGYLLAGPRALSLNVPTPRVIVHPGRDRVEETDQLPSQEAGTAELRTSGVDLDIDAFLQGTKKASLGTYSTFIPRMTDKQGSEPEIGIIAWQQSKLAGARRWHYYLLPSARAIPLNAGMEENQIDHRYSVNINPAGKLPWGAALTELANGALSSGFVDLYSTLRPPNAGVPMVAFKADGVEDTFTFTDYKNGKTDYVVFNNGTLVSAGITKNDGEMVFGAAPTEDNIITVWLV